MDEDQKLKLGDKEFEIKPLPFGALKKLQKQIGTVVSAVDNPVSALTAPDTFDAMRDIVLVAINRGQPEGEQITEEWLDDQLTLENVSGIVRQVFGVSGVRVKPSGEEKTVP